MKKAFASEGRWRTQCWSDIQKFSKEPADMERGDKAETGGTWLCQRANTRRSKKWSECIGVRELFWSLPCCFCCSYWCHQSGMAGSLKQCFRFKLLVAHGALRVASSTVKPSLHKRLRLRISVNRVGAVFSLCKQLASFDGRDLRLVRVPSDTPIASASACTSSRRVSTPTGDAKSWPTKNPSAFRRVWLEGVVPVSVLGLCMFLCSLAPRFCLVWIVSTPFPRLFFFSYSYSCSFLLPQVLNRWCQ